MSLPIEIKVDIQNITEMYQLPEKYVTDIMTKTVSYGKMTFESLAIALKKVWRTCKDKEDFELVCKYFEKITIEGFKMPIATNWWLDNMHPIRPPDTKQAIKSLGSILNKCKKG